MSKIYTSLVEVFTQPTDFTVLESTEKSNADGSKRFTVKLRAVSENKADGIRTEGSQITLYLSSLDDMSGSVKITPSSWDFTTSEFPHPETGEILNLKWLRVTR